MTVLAYQVTEIPDPFFQQYQVEAGGDVLAGIGGSVSIAIRYLYYPKPENGDLQSRLRISLFAKARTRGTAECLRLHFEHGPLGRFYPIKKINPLKISWGKFKAGCEILRRENAIEPLHLPELNDRIPPYYYTVQSFEPNESNNYLALDRLLGGIREAVLINVIAESADISAELSAHTRYLSLLQSINRTWDRSEDEPVIQDYFEDNPDWHQSRAQNIKPLRYPDPLADDILRSQQRFHETLLQPHLQFNISVLTQTQAAVHLIASVLAESAFVDGSYHLLFGDQKEQTFKDLLKSIQGFKNSSRSAHKTVFQGKDHTHYRGLSRLSHVATVEELSGIFRLPVSSNNSPCCIRKNTDPGNENGEKFIVVGSDQNTFSQKGLGIVRGLSLDQLSKHLFESGVSGVSKTTGALNLIFQLHKYGIPFLVIEPVKTEYRILKTFRKHSDKNARRLAKNLEIYTPGNENISPFRYNPLQRFPGISAEERIDNILSCFLAAMPISGPLPALLGEALERVYDDHPKENDPSIVADLVAAVDQVLSEKRYSSETNSDIRAALEVRLGTLIRRNIGKVFQCQQSVPSMKHLMATPTVIELDRLNQEQGCLLSLFLLTSIREYLKTLPQSAGGLRYVIFIEEAHNIAGSSNKAIASPDIADPKAFSTELVCRMLAEFRALGVGIVIIDQFPSAVAPEVIKSTTSKIAFRQVAKDDREELGAAMLFRKTEMEDIARLEVGEAFFITEGFHRPCRIKTVNLHERLDFNIPTLNENILPYLRNDTWFKDAAFERIATELGQLCEKMDRFDKTRIGIIQELANLLARYPKVLMNSKKNDCTQLLEKLSQQALSLKKRLKTLYNSFLDIPLSRYLCPMDNPVIEDPTVCELMQNLVSRFQSVIMPDLKKTFTLIDELLGRCQSNTD
jgi:hypothetical protein